MSKGQAKHDCGCAGAPKGICDACYNELLGNYVSITRKHEALKRELAATQAREAQMRRALIVISDDTWEMLGCDSRPDDDDLYSWSIGYYRRMRDAARTAPGSTDALEAFAVEVAKSAYVTGQQDYCEAGGWVHDEDDVRRAAEDVVRDVMARNRYARPRRQEG